MSHIIAIYGLSTETERFLPELQKEYDIFGLLDGFRTDGEMYGLPIRDLSEVIAAGIKKIIVIARPGSCKAIAKRVGNVCKKNGIELFDIRGNDLLEEKKVSFSLENIKGKKREELFSEIEESDVISFDLFDTLVMRRVPEYTDLFEILASKLDKKGIIIPDFPAIRLAVEKELSKNAAPRLEEIYDEVIIRSGVKGIIAKELDELEWKTDFSLLTPRESICSIFRAAVEDGKRVIVITDSYYTKDRIKKILERFDLSGYESIFVSCEFGSSKTQDLFYLAKNELNVSEEDCILHIGDDEYADIESADKAGLKSFKLLSGAEYFEALGGLGTGGSVRTISDKIKIGLLISKIFNDPFDFQSPGHRIELHSSFDIGYIFVAPILTDYVLWLHEKMDEDAIKTVLFCARDGYLLKELFDLVSEDTRSHYFLSSRVAAIRAGTDNENDIEYVESMKFFGTEEEKLDVRFGVSNREEIIAHTKVCRRNYKQYIDSLGLEKEETAFFDFVAKGTVQLFLSKLVEPQLKGYYFIQNEPEFMKDKDLLIEPFYTEEEKNKSTIFDHYYVLETILTSPDPQVAEFDESGAPIFFEETRSKKDIACILRAQEGIKAYFKDYISVVPPKQRVIDKELDEMILSMVSKISITDPDFMDLKVEDPFFGRMTDIKDLL